jgi:hypothetical protein
LIRPARASVATSITATSFAPRTADERRPAVPAEPDVGATLAIVRRFTLKVAGVEDLGEGVLAIGQTE